MYKLVINTEKKYFLIVNKIEYKSKWYNFNCKFPVIINWKIGKIAVFL